MRKIPRMKATLSCLALSLLACGCVAASPRAVVRTDAAPIPVGPYSQAVRAGDHLYLAGQIGIDPRTGELVEGLEAQVRQALANLAAVLAADGLELSDVVSMTVYLADFGDFAAMNAIYASVVPNPPPARTTIAAAALPRNARVEFSAIAVHVR